MRSPLRFPAVLAVALCAALAPVRAEISPFRVRVEQITKSDNEKSTKKQTRSLKIFVSNSSKEVAELKAKYIFFGKEGKKSDVVKIDEGEKAVSVGALATQMVETGTTTAIFEEEHSESSGKGGKSYSGKKVEASGEKLTGYGVQVFLGDKMVAEYYDPPSGKEEWSRAMPVKRAAAPKKK